MGILVFDFLQFLYKNYRIVQKLQDARKVLFYTHFLTFETRTQIWDVTFRTAKQCQNPTAKTCGPIGRVDLEHPRGRACASEGFANFRGAVVP